MERLPDARPLLPKRLLPGDTIGIAAPSSSFDRNSFDRGIHILEQWGFRTHIPESLFRKKGYLAGPDIHRADLLNGLFADKTVKGIVCARGGFGAIRTLSLLDFESIRENPKIFFGFSDISAILSVLHQRCGLLTFHGPMVTTLGDADQETASAMLSTLSSDAPFEMRLEKGITLIPGTGRGILSGGNLSTLCHLLGTPFQADFRGHILFLEDRGEASYKIDRMLFQMKLAGCFDALTGLVLGSFEGCGSEDEIFRIVKNVFRESPIPILAGLDAGHGKRNLSIPMGIRVTLDADARTILSHEAPTIPAEGSDARR
ncbi:MAG: hypothetical protein B6245_03950 [Desulfobacteraceae bacterium 4572_88]|nr:MAG: hypothetical protein B6245_03950 [Desulfobacteraceae bacterium 4572_88]RLC21505.1 MAG: LD-carboxypeptidase [Deltaproteobacteria bacterium]